MSTMGQDGSTGSLDPFERPPHVGPTEDSRGSARAEASDGVCEDIIAAVRVILLGHRGHNMHVTVTRVRSYLGIPTAVALQHVQHLATQGRLVLLKEPDSFSHTMRALERPFTLPEYAEATSAD